jgi:hypothetical protein
MPEMLIESWMQIKRRRTRPPVASRPAGERWSHLDTVVVTGRRTIASTPKANNVNHPTV